MNKAEGPGVCFYNTPVLLPVKFLCKLGRGQYLDSLILYRLRSNVTAGGLTVRDGWVTCDFTSSLAIFQSYQDHGRVDGCVQRNNYERPCA